ncbi:DUF3311 domain-containing protein [Bacillus mangrovi]|uniref:DUF3311 domain-containing protein n=1 Tax=Metabacillus mangrovi TaxID=1491830 RepID=A0A7X2S421_9BACI|nr:DUF3311 domain-containing protein [Metabacillus mangrovi]MTH53017.1 DUF3311 domain-containing protein [Metabacillus mangrovi]
MKPVYLLALLPVLGFFGGLAFANRVEPYVMGLPFFFFWMILWVVLTSVIMSVIYWLDPSNKEELK